MCLPRKTHMKTCMKACLSSKAAQGERKFALGSCC